MPDRATAFSRHLDWNLLKVFNEIVQAGGVTQAARELSRKQPALSLALKRLEDRLGVVLCVRGPGGFRLTDEGQLIAETCRQLSNLVTRIPDGLANISEEVRGRVRVQLISSIVNPVLDEAIAAFHANYPKVEIVVDVTTWDVVDGALLRNEIDIGLAPARFQQAELRYDLLFREVHRPYCGRAHPLFGRRFRDPGRLAGEAFVLTGADEPDQLTKYRLRHGLGTQVAGLSEHLEEAKRLTILGVGLCFLPENFAAPDVAAGRLWPLTPPAPEPAMDIYVITNPRAPRHLAKQLFLEELWRRLPDDGMRQRPTPAGRRSGGPTARSRRTGREAQKRVR